MGTIRLLPDLVASKIAAGEVVERPASVIKELMENALDAGAHDMRVAVAHGGKSYMRVQDNGCGMDRQDTLNCIRRHATSKITDIDDITTIRSFGFRGEALASIASVSKLNIAARQPPMETATVISVRAGEIVSETEGTSGPGTTIEVSDLFFNVPARKKFLKSDAAEHSAIAEVFSCIALSAPECSFSLSRNSREVSTFPCCTTTEQRIRQIYGASFAEHLYPLTVERPDISISGYIGAPEHNRINRTGQKFFVNRRCVQAAGLKSALSRGYEEFLPNRRFPVAVLFFDIDPELVDVNVHPTKREIRFRNERFLMDLLVQTVKNVLRSQGFSSQASLSSGSSVPSFFAGRPDTGTSGAEDKGFILRQKPAPWELSDTQPHTDDVRGIDYETTLTTPAAAGPMGVRTVIGQVLGTYILAETDNGLCIIDQHAAHERIVYEELLRCFSRQKKTTQTLLFPITMHLTLQEKPILQAYLDEFKKMGFGVTFLGGETYSVTSVPVSVLKADVATMIRDTLHELMQNRKATALETRGKTVAALLACKSHSVKAGKALNPEEMAALVQGLAGCNNPHSCPHGRPTCYTLTRRELEKVFARG